MTSLSSGPAQNRYSRVAIFLHWAIAGFIILNLGLGFFMDDLPPALRWAALLLHVSSGMTVLALTVVRVVWRLLNAPPPFPAGMKPWERNTAHLTHFALYAAMVLMPLTGWGILSAHPPPGSAGDAAQFAILSAAPPDVEPGEAPPGGPPAGPPPAPRAIKIWNVIPMPVIKPIEALGKEPGGVAPQHVLHEQFAEWHEIGAFLLLGLLLLHVLGALKHQFIDKEAEFARMGIGRRRPS